MSARRIYATWPSFRDGGGVVYCSFCAFLVQRLSMLSLSLSLCIYRYSSCVIRECARGYAKMMGLDLGGEKER